MDVAIAKQRQVKYFSTATDTYTTTELLEMMFSMRFVAGDEKGTQYLRV
jgi:hypothetical protein